MKNVCLSLRIIRAFNNKNDSINQVFDNKYIYKRYIIKKTLIGEKYTDKMDNCTSLMTHAMSYIYNDYLSNILRRVFLTII